MPSLTLANSLRATITYSPFSPASLFSGGAPGVWYDPSSVLLDWRYNLLTYTEQFDDAVWTKTNASITPNTTTAPDGATTADSLIEDSASAWHRLNSATFSYTGTYTLSIAAKANTRGWLAFCFYADAVAQITYFDLTNGAVGTNAAGSTAAITSLGDGWYRCSVTRTLTGGISQMILAPSTGNNVFSYAGNGTSGIYIWGASLTTAANASLPYQQIVTPEISYLTYQPQPILFQDSAGTTPVTAVEQPVGLMLDKSQGLVLGSELVVNGDFSNGTTGWTELTPTFSVSSGVGVLSGANSTVDSALFSTVIGKSYQFTITNLTAGGQLYYKVRRGDTNANLIDTGSVSETAGVKTFVFTALSSTTYLRFNRGGTAGSTSFDNITVKELPGNHAFQSTSASRPVLSARYNLLTKTEQFDDAAWGKSNVTVTANAIVAPDGTTTADTLLASSTAINTGITRLPNVAANSTVLVYAKRGASNFLGLSAETSAWWANFDLLNGVVGNSGGCAASISNVGNGWYRCSLTTTVSSSYVTYCPITADTTTFGWGASCAAGNSIYVWGASLVPSNQSTLPYQRVNTATDYNTTGFLPYLRFDGVDDSMSTNSINFTSTDKMSVFAGVNSPSATQYSCICALGNFNTQAGAMALASPGLSTYGAAAWVRGLSGRSSADNVSTALKRLVLTAQLSPSAASIADSVNVRINGGSGQGGNSGSLPGGGNFANATLSIGYTAGLNYLNGQLYSMTIVGKQVTATELSSTETYTAIKTGVTLA